MIVPLISTKNEKKGNKGNTFLDQRTYHIRGLHLSATFVRGLFGPASTKEASNKPAENHDRRLKFNSDTIKHF